MNCLKLLKPVVVAGVLFFGIAGTANCQDAGTATINVSGGAYSNDQLHIEWSIGELLRIDTRISENKALIVTQGLLQPDLGRQLILVSDPSFAPGEITILPNPVKTLLQVQVSGRQAGYMRCMLFDSRGVRLSQTGFQYYGYGYKHTINTSQLTAGNYFLYVELEPVTGSQIRKGSYKILKIN